MKLTNKVQSIETKGLLPNVPQTKTLLGCSVLLGSKSLVYDYEYRFQ